MKDKDSQLIWESLTEAFEDDSLTTMGSHGVQVHEGGMETFERYSIEDLASIIAGLKDQLDPEHEYEIKRYLAMAISDLGGTLHETREAPKGKHYTNRGALKSGDADADGDGGPKFRSDPTDKPGPGD